jgi:hypothetical protein
MTGTRHRLLLLFCILWALFVLTACEKDDDGDASDDVAADDDTGPGTSGWAVSSEMRLFKYWNGKILSEVIRDFGGIGGSVLVATNNDEVFFAVLNDQVRTIWAYDGKSFTDVFSSDSSSYECTERFISVGFWGTGEKDFLILSLCNDGYAPTFDLYYEPTDPGVKPYGMFAGFYGGAYPYDETTIYQYDGDQSTALATVPDGEILQAKSLGEDGAAVVTDAGVIWSWNAADGWVSLAEDVPWGDVDMLITDPEGDILYGQFIDDPSDQWAYYLVQDGGLVQYTAFDTSSCCNYSAALMKGTQKAFWCGSKPSDVTCDETDGTSSYLVTETDGTITCQGTAIANQPWMSTLWVQW